MTRAFVVEQYEPKRRTEVLALITALQYAGFTVSPIVGSGLVAIGNRSNPYWVREGGCVCLCVTEGLYLRLFIDVFIYMIV